MDENGNISTTSPRFPTPEPDGNNGIWDNTHNAFIPAFHEWLGIIAVGLFLLVELRRILSFATKPSPPTNKHARRSKATPATRYSINDEEAAPLLKPPSRTGRSVSKSRGIPDAKRVKSITSITSAISGNDGTPATLQDDQTSIAQELHDEVYGMQRISTWLLVVLSAACTALFLLDSLSDKDVFKEGSTREKVATVVYPVFFGIATIHVVFNRLRGHCASAPLQGFYLGVAMAITIEFYDLLANKHEPKDIKRGLWLFSSYGCTMATALLVLSDVWRLRSCKLYEVHAEADLLAHMRTLVKDWVDSGGYDPEKAKKEEDKQKEKNDKKKDELSSEPKSPKSEDSELLKKSKSKSRKYKKRFADLSGKERCEASIAFAKEKLSSKLAVKLMYRMVMGVDGALMMTGVVGSVLAMLGLVLSVLQVATAQTAAADAMSAFDTDAEEKIYKAARGFVGPILILTIGMSLGNSFVEITGERMVCRLQRLTFVAICQQDTAFFDENKVGELTSLMSTNPGMMRNAMTTSFANCIQNIARLVLCLVFMLHGVNGSGSPKLFGYIIAMGLVPITCICVMMTKAAGFSKRQTETAAVSTGISTEMITSIKTLVSFNMLPLAELKYSNAARKTMAVGIEKDIWNASLLGIVYGSWITMQGMVWVIGGIEVHKGIISFTYLAAFSSLVGQVLQGVMGIFQIMPAMGQAVGAANKLFAVALRHPRIDSARVGTVPAVVRGEIELKNVKFNYPTRPEKDVFKSLSLTIPSGKSIALVGKSGTGKSTILQLVQRFYDPDEGAVTLDGVDLKDLDLGFLHDYIGLVMQEPRLLSGTIHDNILGDIDPQSKSGKDKKKGDKDSNDAEVTQTPRHDVVQAAKLANAHDFIVNQPQGYFTEIGEGGATLSGGQKQRVAIARAVFKDPRVLLLDEATSALDSSAEHEVQAALDSASKGRTTITVAHRKSAIEKADIICVLDNGAIVEMGTHKELLQNSTIYKELYGNESSS